VFLVNKKECHLEKVSIVPKEIWIMFMLTVEGLHDNLLLEDVGTFFLSLMIIVE
jgi:hypothetical protein